MLLIDEPFTGLSPKNLILVSDSLKAINQNNKTTLLIAEQRVKECLSISTKVIALKLGKIFSLSEVSFTFNVHELNSVFI